MVALLYKADAYSSNISKIMGRNVAGSTFLGARIEYGELESLSLFVDDGASQKSAIELKSARANGS